jgi:phytoene dehydrogenase-like protein
LYDAVVIGSGPNGLAAAVEIARAGRSVLVLEAESSIGGGTRTVESTLPGFLHDQCSAVHPMGVLSPFLRTLPLNDYGLEWVAAPASVAHPLDDGPAAILERSLQKTGETLGADAGAWRRLIEPFLHKPHALFRGLLAPLRLPRNPLLMTRFAWYGLRSASSLAQSLFSGPQAKALLAGCAAHSILPLDRWLTGAVGLVFAISGHVEPWPCARGGSQAISRALANYLRALGGEVETDRRITSLKQLPPHRTLLMDLAPKAVVQLAGHSLPARYGRRLLRYRYGPGAFKLDWALDGPIPWKDPACARASTVHVGGTLAEVSAAEAAPWQGRHPERPFVLVCQQSHFDATRAPAGKHTGYAYCHVPSGSTEDMTARIEAQVERFAPGFRDRILARSSTNTLAFERRNPNYVGGAITGGVADWRQLFSRPVLRWNPYTTPNPQMFICSASTPPGGGVHGMCGYYAAQAALGRLRRL